MHPDILVYRALASEKTALAQISQQWDFWPLTETLQTLAQPSCKLHYMPSTGPELWKGLLLTQRVAPVCDLLFIYTSRESRGQGVALALLENLWEELHTSRDIETLMLEVRPSNLAAIALYEKFGMQKNSVRKKYYADGEDAFIYIRALDTGA